VKHICEICAQTSAGENKLKYFDISAEYKNLAGKG
jgi:hypothetical protein